MTIKQIRTKKGYTSKDFAHLIGTSECTYLKKENGQSKFTSIEIIKICNLYDVALDYIQL